MASFITKIQEYLLTFRIVEYYPIIGSFIVWLYGELLIFYNNLAFRCTIINSFFISMIGILFLSIISLSIFIISTLKFYWLYDLNIHIT